MPRCSACRKLSVRHLSASLARHAVNRLVGGHVLAPFAIASSILHLPPRQENVVPSIHRPTGDPIAIGLRAALQRDESFIKKYQLGLACRFKCRPTI